MSRDELADKVGYKWPSFITMLENATAEFPVDKWEVYAEALEVPKHEFLKVVLEENFPEMMPYLSVHNRQKRLKK